MKKLFILSLILIAGVFASNAQQSWVSFNGKTASEPIISIDQNIDNMSMIVDIEIPGVWVTDIQQDGITYKRFELIARHSTRETGLPELPMLSHILGLPGNTIAHAEVIEETRTSFEQCTVYPFQEPTKDGIKEKPAGFLLNKDFYQSSSVFPSQMIYVDKPNIWRDVRVSGLHIIPCSYKAAEKRLDFVTHLKLRVDFIEDQAVEPLNRSKSVSPTFYNMYKNSLANFDMMGLKQLLSSTDTTTKYLIITNNEALNAIQPLVNWKNEQGFRVEVRTIDAGFSTPQNFFDYILQLYNTDNLEYVLMVGDAYPDGGAAGGSNIVPMYWWEPSGEIGSYSDSWYTCLSGTDDHYADLAIGRFTYDNIAELELQISKTLSHYKTPDTTTSWANNSLLVAHEQDYPQKYTLCKEEIRTYNYPLQTLNFQQCYGGAGASNTDIINYVNNNSCGIFNYRGHGSQTEFAGWSSGNSFDPSHVAQLTNQNKLFVLFDVCCDNMDIVSYYGDCLCESFMKSPNASVAVNGAIIPSFTIPNHDYDKEMYKAVLEEGIYNIGYISNYANITVLNSFGGDGRSNVRTYLWLGDASLEPWTKKPAILSVNHDPQLFLGLSSMPVQVNGVNGPEKHARVCISNATGTIYAYAFTDSTGLATVQFPGPVQDPGTAKVTVTQHNYLPYQGTIQVIPQTGPYVVKDIIAVHDPAGNNNGKLDYNESSLLNVSMKNVGVANTSNVAVKISTTSQYVTITDSVESYGVINAGSSVNVNDAFGLNVAVNVPNGTNVPFKVTADDGVNTWVSNFNLTAFAPVLNIGDYSITDPGGNNNGKLDPGETAIVSVPIKNIGGSEAFNVTGLLSSTDPYITINSGVISYGNIAGSATAAMQYSVTAASATPPGHTAYFTLNINANLGITGTGTFSTVVGQIPVLIIDLDGNNNSANQIFSAIQSLGISADFETTIPTDINLYSSVFLCLGIYTFGNYILSSDEGQALADYLNAGGRLYMEGGDTWYYDSITAVHPMFNINGIADGSSDLATIGGSGTAFTNGMSFVYNGDNNYIDHLTPVSSGFTIFSNSSPSYDCGVANDATTYKTIGCSFEFGGLSDATSPSTKKDLMEQYLIFFGLLNASLNANFSAANTNVCQGTSVTFTDASTGTVTTREWSFPGGTPGSSTLQNPVVQYSSPGLYNVTLIVSDGVDTDTITKINYVNVVAPLPAVTAPVPPASFCQGIASTSLSTTTLPGAISYHWILTPTAAGTINGTGVNAVIYWNTSWNGTATVTVHGVNVCGDGDTSQPVNIIVKPLPVVTFTQLSPVCVYWQPFALNGGSPAGGTYSGTGVSSGMFTPSVAGVGNHTVVYTYIDNNGCSNSTSQSIYVSVCTGVDNLSEQNIRIYPNPSEGNFFVEIDKAGDKPYQVKLMNIIGETVFSDVIQPENGKISKEITLNDVAEGIYMLKIENGDKSLIRKVVIRK